MKTTMKKCHFCNIELNSLITYDIRHAFRRWADGKFDNSYNNSFQLFIPSINKSSCIDCGKKYYLFKFSKNKIKNINKRQITGKINLPKQIDPNELNIKEYCVICNCQIKHLTINTSVVNRDNYIEGIGQFCNDCMIKYY